MATPNFNTIEELIQGNRLLLIEDVNQWTRTTLPNTLPITELTFTTKPSYYGYKYPNYSCQFTLPTPTKKGNVIFGICVTLKSEDEKVRKGMPVTMDLVLGKHHYLYMSKLNEEPNRCKWAVNLDHPIPVVDLDQIYCRLYDLMTCFPLDLLEMEVTLTVGHLALFPDLDLTKVALGRSLMAFQHRYHAMETLPKLRLPKLVTSFNTLEAPHQCKSYALPIQEPEEEEVQEKKEEEEEEEKKPVTNRLIDLSMSLPEYPFMDRGMIVGIKYRLARKNHKIYHIKKALFQWDGVQLDKDVCMVTRENPLPICGSPLSVPTLSFTLEEEDRTANLDEGARRHRRNHQSDALIVSIEYVELPPEMVHHVQNKEWAIHNFNLSLGGRATERSTGFWSSSGGLPWKTTIELEQ